MTPYERDDERRLIKVRVSEPYGVEQILGAIDRQASEGTWDYAMLYDLRGVTASMEGDVPTIAEKVKKVGAGRTRGPVGLAIRTAPDQMRTGLRYSELTRRVVALEVLLTDEQVREWIKRNSRRPTSAP